MKDSRVGAFGAIGLCLLILFKYSLLLDIAPDRLWQALVIAPVVGRLASVVVITQFPYVRAEGLGKGLFQHSGKGTLYWAGLFALAVLGPFGPMALIALAAGMAAMLLTARLVVSKLGGMTGDVYGAVIEVTQVGALLGGGLFGVGIVIAGGCETGCII